MGLIYDLSIKVIINVLLPNLSIGIINVDLYHINKTPDRFL